MLLGWLLHGNGKSVVSLSRLPYLVLHSEPHSFDRTKLIKSIMAQVQLHNSPSEGQCSVADLIESWNGLGLVDLIRAFCFDLELKGGGGGSKCKSG